MATENATRVNRSKTSIRVLMVLWCSQNLFPELETVARIFEFPELHAGFRLMEVAVQTKQQATVEIAEDHAVATVIPKHRPGVMLPRPGEFARRRIGESQGVPDV